MHDKSASKPYHLTMGLRQPQRQISRLLRCARRTPRVWQRPSPLTQKRPGYSLLAWASPKSCCPAPADPQEAPRACKRPEARLSLRPTMPRACRYRFCILRTLWPAPADPQDVACATRGCNQLPNASQINENSQFCANDEVRTSFLSWPSSKPCSSFAVGTLDVANMQDTALPNVNIRFLHGKQRERDSPRTCHAREAADAGKM